MGCAIGDYARVAILMSVSWRKPWVAADTKRPRGSAKPSSRHGPARAPLTAAALDDGRGYAAPRYARPATASSVSRPPRRQHQTARRLRVQPDTVAPRALARYGPPLAYATMIVYTHRRDARTPVRGIQPSPMHGYRHAAADTIAATGYTPRTAPGDAAPGGPR